MRQLISGALGSAGERGHRHPNFSMVLPHKMEELVEAGLFVRDSEAEGGYRITPLGLSKLAELERKEKE
mgnify:CR=1 FL=1